jgi:hypothetical protein
VIAGEKTARTPRFVKNTNGQTSLDEASLARARRLVGLKGYVTNIPATLMPAGEVIGSYHDLWHVEQSFRMSKTDLRARPISCRRRHDTGYADVPVMPTPGVMVLASGPGAAERSA